MRESSRKTPPAGGDAARRLFVFLFCRGIASQAICLGMRPAKLCFAPVGDCIPDRNDPPPQGQGNRIPPSPPTSSNPRHSGIFIPPANDSAIATLRWRNENIRNPPRQHAESPTRPCRPLVVPKRRLGMRPAKRRFALPPEKKPRHSGIFIPPANDSAIATLRWRNENIRNPPRQHAESPTRPCRPPCRSQAPLGNASREAPLRLFNQPPFRRE